MPTLSSVVGWHKASLAITALVISCGCSDIYDAVVDPGSLKEAELQRLVREGANEEALRSVVPAGQWNRRGTPEWAGIEEFLAREPKESFRPLRAAMQQYPTIVYHTTAWRMTWVFVDRAGIVRGYYLCAQ